LSSRGEGVDAVEKGYSESAGVLEIVQSQPALTNVGAETHVPVSGAQQQLCWSTLEVVWQSASAD